jgi:hypothetical protein
MSRGDPPRTLGVAFGSQTAAAWTDICVSVNGERRAVLPLRPRLMGGQNVFARVNFLQTTSERIADVARVVRDLVHPGIRDEASHQLSSRSTARP